MDGPLAICSRGLLRQSEEAKYAPINESLARTRTFYIQVWCALLCVPFAVDWLIYNWIITENADAQNPFKSS